MKKTWIKWCLLGLLVVAALVGVPILINECYKVGSGYVTIWNADDVLSYYGTIVGAAIAVATIAVTITFNRKQIQREKQPDHKLPPSYETAFVQLRTLGATASALAAIIPEKSKKIQTNKSDLREISGYLIGLSNSMHTPYDCGASIEYLRAVREWETEIKRLLKIN